MENVRERAEIEKIKKYGNDKICKQLSKLTFSGIHKPYTIYETFTIKKKRSSYG